MLTDQRNHDSLASHGYLIIAMAMMLLHFYLELIPFFSSIQLEFEFANAVVIDPCVSWSQRNISLLMSAYFKIIPHSSRTQLLTSIQMCSRVVFRIHREREVQDSCWGLIHCQHEILRCRVVHLWQTHEGQFNHFRALLRLQQQFSAHKTSCLVQLLAEWISCRDCPCHDSQD